MGFQSSINQAIGTAAAAKTLKEHLEEQKTQTKLNVAATTAKQVEVAEQLAGVKEEVKVGKKQLEVAKKGGRYNPETGSTQYTLIEASPEEKNDYINKIKASNKLVAQRQKALKLQQAAYAEVLEGLKNKENK